MSGSPLATAALPGDPTAAGEGPPPGNAGLPPSRGSRRRRLPPTAARIARHLVAMSPFIIYVFVFLAIPAVAVGVGAFENPKGGLGFQNLEIASSGVYRTGMANSLELAGITSLVPAALGMLVAYAIHVGSPYGLLRRFVVTLSGVFAQFGGVPLAFLFIAAFNPYGLVTGWLSDVGINLSALGFNLYTFTGVAVVYIYFQLPLMVLVVLPAFEGLRPAWREAASNLGASPLRYWRHVAAPALLPTFLGSLLLLFGFGLSAYATADALTSGSLALTTIQIGSFLNGNVLAGQENVGKALGFFLLLVLAVVMTVYSLLQRRVSRWLR